MDIIETINIIKETYEYAYEMYGFSYGSSDSIETFTGGFCYDFFCLLKRFFPTAKLMMQNDKMHCAALIDECLYDVNGLREDLYNFHEATGCDMEYIYKYYGSFSMGFKESLNKLVVKNVLGNKKVSVKTLTKTA